MLASHKQIHKQIQKKEVVIMHHLSSSTSLLALLCTGAFRSLLIGSTPLAGDDFWRSLQVNASLEVSASEQSSAETEQQSMDAVSGQPLVTVRERGDSSPTSASRDDSLVQTVLSKLSLRCLLHPEAEATFFELPALSPVVRRHILSLGISA